MPDPTQPLEGYDDLTANEVVTRLAELSDEEVEAVKQYESAHKDRVTITAYQRPGPPEALKPKGRPIAQEVAEQVAADQRVEEAPDFGGNR